MQETQLRSQDQEDPLEKEMATHSSILTWEIPWTEEPGGLCPWSHTRTRHSLVTKQQHIYISHLLLFIHLLIDTGYFRILALNIGVYISFWINVFVFFRYKPYIYIYAGVELPDHIIVLFWGTYFTQWLTKQTHRYRQQTVTSVERDGGEVK